MFIFHFIALFLKIGIEKRVRFMIFFMTKRPKPVGIYLGFGKIFELDQFDGFIEPLGPTAPFPPILLRKFKFFFRFLFLSFLYRTRIHYLV